MVIVFYLLLVVWSVGLCADFRLPLQIASSYKKHKAANGIQRLWYGVGLPCRLFQPTTTVNSKLHYTTCYRFGFIINQLITKI